ncbi:MAG TPA: OmpA family protein [Longimicrobiales bacterium]|nr:OmpA family protein [Longimicrobiales bacterium]
MKPMQNSSKWIARSGAVAAVAVLTGCGYAKRDDVNAQMDQIRQDMQTADAGVETRMGTRIDGVATRVQTLEQRVQSLQQELQTMRTDFSAQIESMRDMLSFNLPVNFEYDSSDLRSGDLEVLRKFANVVEEYYPNAVVTVEGFTDPSGSAAYNLRLGQNRAESVKAFLVQEGLGAAAIRTVSYGEARERQVVAGAQGPGAQGMQNRRVSLVIDYSGDPLAVRPVTD